MLNFETCLGFTENISGACALRQKAMVLSYIAALLPSLLAISTSFNQITNHSSRDIPRKTLPKSYPTTPINIFNIPLQYTKYTRPTTMMFNILTLLLILLSSTTLITTLPALPASVLSLGPMPTDDPVIEPEWPAVEPRPFLVTKSVPTSQPTWATIVPRPSLAYQTFTGRPSPRPSLSFNTFYTLPTVRPSPRPSSLLDHQKNLASCHWVQCQPTIQSWNVNYLSRALDFFYREV
ncbi:hypothetical protein VTL71DRAFT_13913 [Oculimacula yallundae]|uniref:Uncharacterized protein n=1 Tax=Oculimacula yallundae TaxID=86028 RepID=A0ABR4CMB5_9HELO